MTWIEFDTETPEEGVALRKAGLTARLAPKHGHREPDELARLLDGSVAAIVSTDPFDRSVFDRAPELRVIARVGVGTDSIDLTAATEAGVAVTTTPGANNETVADHTLALLLAAVRRVVEHDAGVRRGEWNRAGPMTGWELYGRTVGLAGYGSIGRAVARRLRGFGVNLLVCDPACSRGEDIELVDLDALMARSDVVSLHLPLTPDTRGLIGKARLARMKPGAILVNTSRGGLVDEASLVEVLAAGRLRAAALDVFELEPPKSEQLRRLPNVVLSPHVGGLSDASISEMTRRAVSSVIGVLDGSDYGAVINPEALEVAALGRTPSR